MVFSVESNEPHQKNDNFKKTNGQIPKWGEEQNSTEIKAEVKVSHFAALIKCRRGAWPKGKMRSSPLIKV